jgi:uncharacterized membrane protein YfbV (UPF0208 family)
MPPIIKQSAPHILISMFVAPIMLGLFAWAGSSILGNREVTVLMPTITKKLDEISDKLDEQDAKQDALLITVYKNKEDIAVIKTIIRGDSNYEK